MRSTAPARSSQAATRHLAVQQSAAIATATGRHRSDTLAGVGLSLRFEIFSADLDVLVDFYTRVLGFALARDERHAVVGYVALDRDAVHIGAAFRPDPIDRSQRLPPTGIEIVLEVDDVAAEHDRVAGAGWPIEEPLQPRPWGLTDFRVLDPAGHYLRITGRAAEPG